jgi:TonB family protein
MLACLPLLQAQDSGVVKSVKPVYETTRPLRQIEVNVEINADGTPGRVGALTPGLPVEAIRALRGFEFAKRTTPYTATFMMQAPAGVVLAAPPFMPGDPDRRITPEAIRVNKSTMSDLAVKRVAPIYPQEAKAGKVQGKVVLSATISKEGKVADLRAITGPMLLLEAALTAVAQWEYRPLMIGDTPQQVVTEVDVTFELN